MSSDCGACTAKFILCAFNFIFFILGTAVLGIGVWLVADKSSFIDLISLIDNHENIKEFAQPEVIDQAAYVLVLAGGVMFFLSFLGYCGALRESQCLLTTYGIFLMILLVLEVAVGGLAVAYKDSTKLGSKTYFQDNIVKYYGNEKKPDAVTLGWNLLMTENQCCGADSWKDFQNAALWINSKNSTDIQLPEACCRMNATTLLDPNCPKNPTTENSYMNTGCFDVFYEWATKHKNIVIATLIVTILVQLTAIFLAFCLCKSLDKYRGSRL